MNPQPVGFDIGALLGESWRLIREDAGPLIGGFVLFSVISSLASSTMVGLVIQGALLTGLFALYLKKARGGQVDIKELFAGFDYFVPSLLIFLVTLFSTWSAICA